MTENISQNHETNSSTISIESPSSAPHEEIPLGEGSCDFLSPQEITERLKVTATEEQLELYEIAIPEQEVGASTKEE